MNEEIALSITIDVPANEQKVTELTNNIETLTEETKKLAEANKQLTKEGKSTSDAYVQNSKQADVNKQKIDANAASRKNLVKTLDTERTSTLGVKDAMGTLSPALSSATTGALSLGRAMLALALNPVGLALGAVAAILGTLFSFFTRTQTGADLLEDAFTSITTTVDVLLDRLARVGGGLVDFFAGLATGNFTQMKEGINSITTAFDGMGKEISEEVDAMVELNEAMRDLEDNEIRVEVAAAKTENTIKRLLLQARNRTISEQERLAILEKASAEEEKLNAKELANAEERVRATAANAARILNIKRDEAETTIEFGNRFLEAFFADSAAQADEERDALKSALIAREQVVGQSIALQEKISNQRDAAQAKIEEQDLKRIELELKIQTELAKRADEEQKEIDRIAKLVLSKENYEAAVRNLTNATTEQKDEVAKLFDEQQMLQNAENEFAKERDVNFDAWKKRIDDIKGALGEIGQIIIGVVNTFAVAGSIISGFNNASQGAFKNRIDELTAEQDKVSENLEQRNEKELESLERLRESQLITDEEYSAKKKAIDKQYKTDSEKLEKDQNKKLNDLKREAFEQNKENQIALAIIATFQSALNAFQSVVGIPFVGPILAPIASAAALSFGFKNVDNIRDTKFTAAAGGGDFLTKGPTLLLVGDNPGGIERVRVEPLSGKGKTVVGGNMIAAAGGIDGLISGSSLTTGSARIAESSFNMERFASMVNQVKVAVIYDDVEAKGLTKEEITTRAQVI